VARLADSLQHQATTLHWQPDQGLAALLKLACLTQMVSPALAGAGS
jgi:hypothetical protein